MTAEEISRFKTLLHTQSLEDSWLQQIEQVMSGQEVHPSGLLAIDGLFQELQARIQGAVPGQPAPVAASTPVQGAVRMLKMNWWYAAAASVLIVGGATYYLGRDKKAAQPMAKLTGPAEIAPGKEGAVLTLADGRQIVLDSLGNGVVATESGARVVLQDGKLTYDGSAESAAVVTYNTITTPNGRQISIVLPDGSKVWLNSASYIRCPTVFPADERLVEISGEAYVEVAPDAQRPFRVSVSNGMQLEVLGTSFNINAYSNEAMVRTTLINGRVKLGLLRQGDQSVTLLPGQQAQVTQNAGKPAVRMLEEEELDKIIAWKNGFFDFDNVRIAEAMRQLERWYNIEVVYEKGIPDITFGGKLRRNLSLEGVLRSLQDSEVHFRLEGRKLVVTL